MKNCLKSLLIVAVFVAASVVGVKGSAAAGPSMGQVNLPAQATPANLMTGTTFDVNTSPVTASPDGSTTWQNYLDAAEGMFYTSPSNVGNPNDPWNTCVWNPTMGDYDCPGGPLQAYTIACWGLAADVVGPSPYWKCAAFHSNTFGPNASASAVAAQFAVGSLTTTGYDQCSWLIPYNPAAGTCGDFAAGVPGAGSPAELGNLMPNLDPYVGKTVNLYANENWCTYLAPPNYDIVNNTDASPNPIHAVATACYGNGQSVGISLLSRTLASNDGPPVIEKVTVGVQAGPTDCHVPKIKGLTLRKAKARLHKAHCGYTVHRVKGKRAGHVRYQPLKVGTGKPRGYKVNLAVVRSRS